MFAARRMKSASLIRRSTITILSVAAAATTFGFATADAEAAPSYSQTPAVFGASGSGPGEFTDPGSVAVDSSTSGSDASAGDVYVVDSKTLDKFSAAGTFVSRITGSTSGTPQGSAFDPVFVAVDPSDGDVYVTDGTADVIDKFDAEGSYVCQISASTTATGCVAAPNPAPAGSFVPFGLAVNPVNGDLYVADREAGTIDVFGAAGAYESRFGGPGSADGQFVGLLEGDPAVDTEGNVYVASGANAEEGRVQEFNAAGHFVKVLDSGDDSRSVAVDLATDDVYVGDKAEGETAINVYDSSGSLITSFGSYLGENEGAETGIAVSSTNGAVYVVSEPNAAGYIFTEASGSANPTVTASGSASEETATSAKLTGTLNPNGTQTTYRFEYGLSSEYEANAPVPDASAPAGSSEESVSASLSSLQPNTTYHFRLAASDGHGYIYGEDETFTTRHEAPLATTGQASTVHPGSATLQGTVNPEHTTTTYTFQYGTSISYGSEAPAPEASAGAGTAAEAVSTAVSGLSQATTYHYRLMATNSAGETTPGEDETFTTPAISLDTGIAGPVAQTTATVEGTLDPGGIATTYEFQYGTSTTYGSSAPAQNAGSGTSTARESATLTRLTPGTTYHYRLVATNSAGTAYGADQTFTTYSAIPGSNPQALSVGQSGTELTSPASPPLLPTLTPTRPAPSSTTSKPKTATRAEKLSKALKQCKRYKNKAKRKSCDHSAHKRYGPKRKASKKHHKKKN